MLTHVYAYICIYAYTCMCVHIFLHRYIYEGRMESVLCVHVNKGRGGTKTLGGLLMLVQHRCPDGATHTASSCIHLVRDCCLALRESNKYPFLTQVVQ